jgi:hypothetical protein
MRKRYRVLLLASIVAALVVPVGYALSLEPPSATTKIARTSLNTAPSAAVVASPMIVHTNTAAVAAGASAVLPLVPAVPDAGKLLIVGTVLFGLSALVRRTS